MSAGADDKRFDATPARRERAKREGDVARSSEVAGVAAFGGGLIALVAIVPLLGAAAAAAIRTSAAAPGRLPVGAVLVAAGLAFVPAVAAAVAGTGASLAQTGGLRVTGLKFAPQKLAPAAGMKRMLGGDALVNAARAALAFIVVSAAIGPTIVRAVAAAGAAGAAATVTAAAALAWEGMVRAAAAACVTGGVFACADYALAHRRWLRGLKMSFDELKRDLREQDGDPHAKAKRKQLHRSMARGAIERTRDASLVVVNPTHVAIALRYAPPTVAVPEILVRASDAAALEVRRLARRRGIPVIEDAPLARWLYRIGAAGQPIPHETFVAVAQVIASLVRSGAIAE